MLERMLIWSAAPLGAVYGYLLFFGEIQDRYEFQLFLGMLFGCAGFGLAGGAFVGYIHRAYLDYKRDIRDARNV
jgi:hypothetical protein